MRLHLNKAVLSRAAAFSLMEVMIASSIGLLVMGGAMFFIKCAGLSLSGITGQTLLNNRAGYAIEFIQRRAQFATSISNSVSGNVLTLSFDDDYTVDSDGDGKAYNDKDHYEQFQFIGVNGSTNTTTTNQLIYIPNTAQTNQQVLIGSGVHNLPSFNIFNVTNGATAIIRFGLVDGYTRDNYQSIDIQATAVPLNRQTTTNIIAVIP
jgi:hypothetical protein